MKIIKMVKPTILILMLSFFSIYFTNLGGYYEHQLQTKNVLTEDAIQRFEQDVSNGKAIIASNYIEKEKNYSNKPSKIAMKISNFISKSFDKSIKFVFKQIEKTVNS